MIESSSPPDRLRNTGVPIKEKLLSGNWGGESIVYVSPTEGPPHISIRGASGEEKEKREPTVAEFTQAGLIPVENDPRVRLSFPDEVGPEILPRNPGESDEDYRTRLENEVKRLQDEVAAEQARQAELEEQTRRAREKDSEEVRAKREEFVREYPILFPGDDGSRIRSKKLPTGEAEVARFSEQPKSGEPIIKSFIKIRDGKQFKPKGGGEPFTWRSATSTWEIATKPTITDDLATKMASTREELRREGYQQVLDDENTFYKVVEGDKAQISYVKHDDGTRGNRRDLVEVGGAIGNERHKKYWLGAVKGWSKTPDATITPPTEPARPGEGEKWPKRANVQNAWKRVIEKVTEQNGEVRYEILQKETAGGEKQTWATLRDEARHTVWKDGKKGTASWEIDLGDFEDFLPDATLKDEKKTPDSTDPKPHVDEMLFNSRKPLHPPDKQASDVLHKAWEKTLDYKTRRIFEKRRGVIFERGKRVGPEAVEAMIKAQEQFRSLPWWQRYGLGGALVGGAMSGGVLGALTITGILALPALPAILGGAAGANIFRLIKHNLDRRNATGRGGDSFFSRNPTTTAALAGVLAGSVSALTSHMWWSNLFSAEATGASKGWFSSLLDWFTGTNIEVPPPGSFIMKRGPFNFWI